MPKITLEHVTKRWGKYYAVDDLNLVIENNSFVTLLGPSGCGKTTTLRMIAGLETPTSGKIMIGEQVVYDSEQGINIPPNKRKVGFLFQNYALWPNMTVYQNIEFGLKNVKEELPLIDFEVKVVKQLINILQRSPELIRMIEDSYDKRGNLDNNKLKIKLIDGFFISSATAKKIIDFHFEKKENLEKIGEEIKILQSNLERSINNYKEQGIILDEECQQTKNKEVLTLVRKLSKEEIDLAVRRVSRIVKIGMYMDRYPSELSGGQQQRVAIARTLAPEPSVLFMDEPLSNLDAKLRLEMRSELQRLHIETGSTFVYVTHDQMEAMTLATSICLIDNGVLQQYDKPLKVYGQPHNLFVADFVGSPSINFVEARGSFHGCEFELTIFEGKKIRFSVSETFDYKKWLSQLQKDINEKKVEKKVEKVNKDYKFNYIISKVDDMEEGEIEETDNDFVIGIRPECITIKEKGLFGGEIYSAMPTGMETTVRVRIGNLLFTGVIFGGVTYQIGERVNLDFTSNALVLFHKKSGRIITTGKIQ